MLAQVLQCKRDVDKLPDDQLRAAAQYARLIIGAHRVIFDRMVANQTTPTDGELSRMADAALQVERELELAIRADHENMSRCNETLTELEHLTISSAS